MEGLLGKGPALSAPPLGSCVGTGRPGPSRGPWGLPEAGHSPEVARKAGFWSQRSHLLPLPPSSPTGRAVIRVCAPHFELGALGPVA